MPERKTALRSNSAGMIPHLFFHQPTGCKKRFLLKLQNHLISQKSTITCIVIISEYVVSRLCYGQECMCAYNTNHFRMLFTYYRNPSSHP